MATAAGCYLCYRHKLHDMIPLALIVMNVCVVIVTLIGKIIFETARNAEAGCFLALALVVIATASAGAFWLKKTASTMALELVESEAP